MEAWTSVPGNTTHCDTTSDDEFAALCKSKSNWQYYEGAKQLIGGLPVCGDPNRPVLPAVSACAHVGLDRRPASSCIDFGTAFRLAFRVYHEKPLNGASR
jgi:hypothetical protein